MIKVCAKWFLAVSLRNKRTTGRSFLWHYGTAHKKTRHAHKCHRCDEARFYRQASVDALEDSNIFKNDETSKERVKTEDNVDHYFSDIKGVIMIDRVLESQTVNQKHHREVLIRLRRIVRKEKWQINAVQEHRASPKCIVRWTIFSEQVHFCARTTSVFVRSIPKSETCNEGTTFLICGKGESKIRRAFQKTD